jgi:ABC-type branched-subunit amino acid transport system ATPase component
MTAPPLLSVTGLTVTYGDVAAVDDVSFEVAPGQITGLIGPNGAGKTSLIDAVSGFTPCRGSTVFAGERIDAWPAYRRSRAGLVRTFQSVELFDDLTVLENIAAGASRGSRRGTLGELLLGRGSRLPGVVDELLTQFDLTALAGASVRELSQGHQKLVTIVRALAGRPKLVLLDEPAAGLGSRDSAWLGEQLIRIRDSGVTVLLVDHDMSLVLTVCTALVVLDFGRLIAAGPARDVREDPAVVQAYLGATHAAPDREPAR